MNRLSDELRARAQASAARVSPEIRAAMAAHLDELRASGIVERAVGVGDLAPGFDLPDAAGGRVSLEGLLARGPAVISFYRGGWCPYCSLELRALEAALDGVAAVGASLVAISPNVPDEATRTVARHGLRYPVLSDLGNVVARTYGLVFALPDDLVEIYREWGFDLVAANGDDRWEIPIPATYVVGTDGTVGYAFVDVDYRRRAEPADVLAAVAALAGSS